MATAWIIVLRNGSHSIHLQCCRNDWVASETATTYYSQLLYLLSLKMLCWTLKLNTVTSSNPPKRTSLLGTIWNGISHNLLQFLLSVLTRPADASHCHIMFTWTSHVHDARYISTWYDTRIYSLIDKIHHSWYAIIQIMDTGSRMSSECLPWHVILQMYWPNEVSKQWRMVEGSQSSSKQMNLKENKSEQRDRGYQLLDNNLLNYYPVPHCPQKTLRLVAAEWCPMSMWGFTADTAELPLRAS